jgi:phosphoglycolate phosphatase
MNKIPEILKNSKLAIIVPGIGYGHDKPILYYSTKLMQELGYEIIKINYHNLPENLYEDDDNKKLAVKMAAEQLAEQLENADLSGYSDIVFAGKSLGTVVSAKYVHDTGIDARQIWYTPVEKTFSFKSRNVLAFIGDADPWSDIDKVREAAKEIGAELHVYEGCDHSLMCESIERHLHFISDSLTRIREFLK